MIRVTSIALIAAILVAVSGLKLQYHYCAGKLSDFSVLGKVKTCCKHASLPGIDKKSCCETFEFDTKYPKHNIVDRVLIAPVGFSELNRSLDKFNFEGIHKVVIIESNKAPPETSKVPIYLRLSSRIIYG